MWHKNRTLSKGKNRQFGGWVKRNVTHYVNAGFEFISVCGGLHSVPPTLREKPGMDLDGAIKK